MLGKKITIKVVMDLLIQTVLFYYEEGGRDPRAPPGIPLTYAIFPGGHVAYCI